MRRHPELDTPVRLHTRARGYVPLADRWVTAQRELLEAGLSWQESWHIMEQRYQDLQYRNVIQRGIAAKEAHRKGKALQQTPLDEVNERSAQARAKHIEQDQAVKFEKLDALLAERRANNDSSLISNAEFDTIGVTYADKLAYYRANPSARRYFDEHLEVHDFSVFDIEHEAFRDVDPHDNAAVEAAYLKYDEQCNLVDVPLDLLTDHHGQEVRELRQYDLVPNHAWEADRTPRRRVPMSKVDAGWRKKHKGLPEFKFFCHYLKQSGQKATESQLKKLERQLNNATTIQLAEFMMTISEKIIHTDKHIWGDIDRILTPIKDPADDLREFGIDLNTMSDEQVAEQLQNSFVQLDTLPEVLAKSKHINTDTDNADIDIENQ